MNIHPQDQLKPDRATSLLVLGLILLQTYYKYVPISIKNSDSCRGVKD